MNREKYQKKNILLGIMLISFLNCVGDTENKNNYDEKQRNPDPESSAISPQKEYTKDKPAEWEPIANDHLPEIIFDKSKTKDNIQIKVPGKKFTERHYIEIIGLMDEHKAEIDVKKFERGNNPIAILTLNQKEYEPENIKVFVKCNLHDLWTVSLISKE